MQVLKHAKGGGIHVVDRAELDHDAAEPGGTLALHVRHHQTERLEEDVNVGEAERRVEAEDGEPRDALRVGVAPNVAEDVAAWQPSGSIALW